MFLDVFGFFMFFKKLCFPIFHVFGKYLILSWPKKYGRKFEISNPSVENFDMNIQKSFRGTMYDLDLKSLNRKI